MTKFVHPVSLEPEVTGCLYLRLCTLKGPILVYLTEKINGDHEFFWLKSVWFQVEWPNNVILYKWLLSTGGYSCITVQSTKILLVHPKFKTKIDAISNCKFSQYCTIFLGVISLLLLFICLSIVITLPTTAISIVIAFSRS